MLNFVKNAFSKFMEVILWINLILCVIGGWVVGGINDDHPFLGGILGFVVGMLSNIVGGGFIATILNMDSNLEKLLHKGVEENTVPKITTSAVKTMRDSFVRCGICKSKHTCEKYENDDVFCGKFAKV
jgi:hypothetical protein